MIIFRNSAPRLNNSHSVHRRPYTPLDCGPVKIIAWHSSPADKATCNPTEPVAKKPKKCEHQDTSSPSSLKLTDGSSRVAFYDRSTQVVDTKDALILSVDLPGVSSKDVTIAVADGVLSMEAERHARAGGSNSTKQKHQFWINERKVHVDKLTANLADGVLTVTLPKKEESKPISIPVATHGPPDDSSNNNNEENKDEANVWQFTCDLPGVQARDIQLELHDETLTLQATRKNWNGRTSSTDQKILVDSTQVDTKSIQAHLADGVLTLIGTRRKELAKAKVIVPVSYGNTELEASNPGTTKLSDENQEKDENSTEESQEQDDLVIVETVNDENDDEKK